MREKEGDAITGTGGWELGGGLDRLLESLMLPEADNEDFKYGTRRGTTKPELLLMLWTWVRKEGWGYGSGCGVS